jgi:hypothetical protein
MLHYRSGDLAGNFEKEKSLSIPIAEELPTMNYRSIGTRPDTLFCEGTASVSAGSMTVSFSMALPDFIGAGDKLILGTHGPFKEVLYILERLSPNVVSVQAAPTKDHIDVPFEIRRAYRSIQSWENHRQGDLVAENRLEIGVCYNDGPFKKRFSLALATIDGSITDETHFLWLTAAEGHRHYGVAGEGVVLDGRNRTMMGIRIHDDFTRIDGLELKRFRRFHGAAAVVVGRARNVVLEQLLIHDFDSRWYGVTGIRGMPKSDFTVRNSIIYDGGSAGIWSVSPRSTATIENCTIHGMNGRGIDEGRGYFTVVNTISMDNECADFDVTRGLQSYNLSSDDTALGPGSIVNASAPEQFVSIDPGAEDFHLKVGSAAIDSGTELELFYAVDIDDEERPMDAGWDMGADEFSDLNSGDVFGSSIFGFDRRKPFRILGRVGEPINFDFGTPIARAQPSMSTFFAIRFPDSLYSH